MKIDLVACRSIRRDTPANKSGERGSVKAVRRIRGERRLARQGEGGELTQADEGMVHISSGGHDPQRVMTVDAM